MCALLAGGAPAAAATLLATSSTLAAIFRTVNAGDTIKLSGTFTAVTRLSNRSFAKSVTIDASKATFKETLDISGVDGLKVFGGKFDVRSDATTYGRAVVVYNGSNIWFDKPTILGGGSQQGISFAGTDNVEVSNGSFTGLFRAINIGDANGGLVTHNKITHAVSDGIDIGNSHHVTATFNACSLSDPGPGVHPDCIQLWSMAGRPIQSYNTISDNSATGNTQGFTSFANGGGGSHITIIRNRAYTSYPQGVACYDCTDSNISFNTVSTIPGSLYRTNINVIGGSNNIVLNNSIGAYSHPAYFNGGIALGDYDPALDATGNFDGATPLASSNAPLLEAGSASAVVEPATWALLLAGFGLVGTAARRRAPAATLA